ncbi:tRNA-uridine aminocarboxypropyltransferase [Rhodopirellula sallentina]|uniref:tRNA-uridine aminocarboxypropyltransferase n=1 Tax=Rhodopirellula sallentina SM41 TaxID=1263870 RepID=M5TUC5_9BACT|nr:tRNA-uridine aminocarboxypropyltransferase [Rhodopirellula sallentina]EMI52760.1 DTW domain-containing protein [Rhodopirellula sallentina SM41]
MTQSARRCFRCFRPRRMCYCNAISPVQHRTSVLILQHRRERFHPFNTARIVHASLDRCELMTAYNVELAEQFAQKTLPPKTGVLYPGRDAMLLDDLRPEERPEHLVILDGTWHQAKTLYRDIPRLQTLPQYRLSPASPGRYRIRREPNEHALSTLEATVAALMALEPDNQDLPRLLQSFDRMIEDQLDRQNIVPDAAPLENWRRNERRRRGSANVPRALTENLDRVIVAYGERDLERPTPIYWTAMRLGTGERFECVIDSPSLHDTNFTKLLHLDHGAIEGAVDIAQFRNAWRDFVQPNDHVAMRHQGTARLLEAANAVFAPNILLKAINSPVARMGSHDRPIETGESRGKVRLEAAVDFVGKLNTHHPRHDPATSSVIPAKPSMSR